MAGNKRNVRGPLGEEISDDLTRKKSEYVNLNTQYGQLNPLYDSGISDVPFNQREKVGYFRQSKKQLESSYAADVFANSGPYVGVVLRIDSNEIDIASSENNWLTRAQLGRNADPPPLLSLRVRIPELHAALPIPTTFSGKSESSSDNISDNLPKVTVLCTRTDEEVDKSIIDMYPVFSSVDTKSSAYIPEVGSLVWVDFVDKKTQSAGVYLRPVNSDKTTINSEAGAGSSSEPFNTKSQKSTGASAATGGSSSGQVAKSNSTNSPTLQKQGANFYSSKGGFILPARTTLGGLESKYENKNNMRVMNGETYKIKTNIRYLKNIQIASNGDYGLRTNRVRPYAYGSIEKMSQNLVDVPTLNGIKRQKLHVLAAMRLEELNVAWFHYISSGAGKTEYLSSLADSMFKVSRGFEEHRYNNNYDSYSDKMVKKYGSINEAQRYEPFRSVYETGLVFDIGNNGFQGGLSVVNSFTWDWLIENAYLYGIYPSGVDYKRWEVQLPRKNWFSGKEFSDSKTGSIVDGKYYKYCTYVMEESQKSGRLTSDEKYESQVFE